MQAESLACGLPTSFLRLKTKPALGHAARPTAAVAPTLAVLLYRAAGATLAAPGGGVLWTAASQTTLRNSSRFLAHAPRSGTQGLAPRYKARTTAPSTPSAKFRAPQNDVGPPPETAHAEEPKCRRRKAAEEPVARAPPPLATVKTSR